MASSTPMILIPRNLAKMSLVSSSRVSIASLQSFEGLAAALWLIELMMDSTTND